ncbi:MAG: lipoyl(octanoyl) transferase LipB [Coxiellaceae bacterium]|nr:lipoyl(octanoyl) transferase LipB [Coxiellaceae bacterium]
MHTLIIRDLSCTDYEKTWQDMRDFTDNRHENTMDELWLLEHSPVFTQGLAGKPEHILNPHHIPVVQTDRGGQVTYHGPGQLVVYALFDLKRNGLFARDLVRKLENSVIDTLKKYNIAAKARCDAPGVYVGDAKICSIGLRVRKNCSYHGIALNVDMDLNPFHYINPCGHQGMQMTQIKSFFPNVTIHHTKKILVSAITKNFGYTKAEFLP